MAMFVPRALRLKGINEARTQKPARKRQADTSIANTTAGENYLPKETTPTISPSSPAKEQDRFDQKVISRGPSFASTPVTPDYIAQLAAGVELIFTDYALQYPESSTWLRERYRTVGGEKYFIHLAAILDHSHISSIKPQATQLLIQEAIKKYTEAFLELSANGYYVRRRPSTYPLSFIPQTSFDDVNDYGLSFWDQRTIYVEPHIRHLCKTPAKVAHWLKMHGQMKPKWLPIQAVHTLYNSCAFVVLSGSVMHEDIWEKWRSTGKPEDWNVMTKVEHIKRRKEYLELLGKKNPNLKRKIQDRITTEETTLDAQYLMPKTIAIREGHLASKKKR